MEQATNSLNMMQALRVNPKISAYKNIFEEFDFNAM